MIRIALLIALLNVAFQLQAQRNRSLFLRGWVWQPDGTKAFNGSVFQEAVYELAQKGFDQPNFYESLLSFRQLSFYRKQPDLDIGKYYSLLAI